jgi:hypothetical protein
MDSLLPALTRQPLLLCLEVAEIWALNATRDDLRREAAQLAAKCVAMHPTGRPA